MMKRSKLFQRKLRFNLCNEQNFFRDSIVSEQIIILLLQTDMSTKYRKQVSALDNSNNV